MYHRLRSEWSTAGTGHKINRPISKALSERTCTNIRRAPDVCSIGIWSSRSADSTPRSTRRQKHSNPIQWSRYTYYTVRHMSNVHVWLKELNFVKHRLEPMMRAAESDDICGSETLLQIRQLWNNCGVLSTISNHSATSQR